MQSNDTVLKRKYTPRQPRVEHACDHCGALVSLKASHARSYKRHFCSEPCRDTFTGINRRVDPVIRFWEKVDKNGPLPTLHPEYGNCWPRRGANQGGYSVIGFRNGKYSKATHFAWDLADGTPLPPGTFVGHVCDNPPCVRNDSTGTYEVDGILYERHGHLWLAVGSPANSRDMAVKGRASKIGNPLFKLKGEEHLSSKLTSDVVRTVRALYAAGGIRQKDIARQLGLSQAHVSRIVRREVWAHLD